MGDAPTDPSVAPLAKRVALGAIGGGLLLVICFPERTDYAGHYVAGLAGTLGLFGMLLLGGGVPLRRAVVPVVLFAIAIGAAFEATLFRIAIFDPVDFAVQSVGAVVAGAIALDERPRERAGRLLLASGLLLLAVGSALAFA